MTIGETQGNNFMSPLDDPFKADWTKSANHVQGNKAKGIPTETTPVSKTRVDSKEGRSANVISTTLADCTQQRDQHSRAVQTIATTPAERK